MNINKSLIIPDGEFHFLFVHASGPGGQNVNKVSTAVQLRFDILGSPSLPLPVKERFLHLAGNKVSKDGWLMIEAKRYRSTQRNILDSQERFKNILLKALIKPKARFATTPTSSSKNKRLQEKKNRGEIKRLRKNSQDTG